MRPLAARVCCPGAHLLTLEALAPPALLLHSQKGCNCAPLAAAPCFSSSSAGCNDGHIPHLRHDDGPDKLAEERRLFFVSLTRAKQRLRLSHTGSSSLYGLANRCAGGSSGTGAAMSWQGLALLRRGCRHEQRAATAAATRRKA